MQLQSNIVGSLATHRDNDTSCILELINIEYRLQIDILEVETISFVVVSGDRFWVELGATLAHAIREQIGKNRIQRSKIEFRCR